MSSRPVDIKDVVRELTARIDALCHEFFPRAIKQGRYCIPLCPWRVDKTAGSFVIYLDGSKQGRWKDHSTGEYGDALDLVMKVECEGDKRRAVQWSLRWLGYDVAGGAPKTTRPAPPPRDLEAEAAQAEKDRKSAHGIWLAGREGAQLLGSPVDRYLRGRGIDIRRLPKLPGAIRFHPDLWHRPSKRHWPAMVTAIQNEQGRFLAVHRTWLEIQADGSVRKAPLDGLEKMTWPGYHGGFIRLARGASGKPMSQAPAGEDLWVAEGNEDGLTAALAGPELRIIGSVSLSNLGNLELRRFKSLHLLLQNDTKAATLAQRDCAIAELQKKGHEVWLHKPPPSVKDINELLNRGAA